MSGNNHLTVAAYYFPNFHVDSRNEAQHGVGWTEWELIKQAQKRFEGHSQPRIPLWGYEDESDPSVMARKIKAAADHGVDVFLFDWYYYNDGPFLIKALERGFLRAANNNRIKFALMWANHDWTDVHPVKRSVEPLLLFPGKVSPHTFQTMTDYIVDSYFNHPSYWMYKGEPYFSVYDLSKLMESFGSVENTRRALDDFREKTCNAGFSGLHLNAVVWSKIILPGEGLVENPHELIARLGFDSVTSYTWIHHVPFPHFPNVPYHYFLEGYLKCAEKAIEKYNVPYFMNVSVGWDNTPRYCQSDVYDQEGCAPIIVGNEPTEFGKAFLRISELALSEPRGNPVIMINAWNEWPEGSYLEPDSNHGMAYLIALRDAKRKCSPSLVKV